MPIAQKYWLLTPSNSFKQLLVGKCGITPLTHHFFGTTQTFFIKRGQFLDVFIYPVYFHGRFGTDGYDTPFIFQPLYHFQLLIVCLTPPAQRYTQTRIARIDDTRYADIFSCSMLWQLPAGARGRVSLPDNRPCR